MARISCPVLLVLGEQDQMTPSKAAQGLVHAAQTAGKSVQVVQVPVGHHQMAEAPELTLKALQGFLAA
jgi:pimeloyl-ACP methyl ester carboxylesterase